MCFVLYAGTSRPLPRREWDKHAPSVSVRSLNETDLPVRLHFTHPEVQNIGSTSCCGCDFPHVTLTRGDWIGYQQVEVDDPEREAVERRNREGLVDLLKRSGEPMVELYGIWLTDGEDFLRAVNFREEIPLTRILEPTFRFKERGFYQVTTST
jgi:hypothetical protein